MRALAVPALSALLLLGGCDGFGGAEGTGGGEPREFVVTARYPGPGSSGVPVSSFVEVTFNVVIDPASVDAGAVLLNGVAQGDPTVNGMKLRFTPAGDLLPGTSYAVTLDPTLSGTNGFPLGASPVWGFKTAGSPPPPDTLPPLGPRPR